MRFFVLPIFNGVIMDGHPPRLKYWMPIRYDTIEDGQNKKSHVLFSLFFRIVLFLFFIGEIYCQRYHFIGFI